MRIRFQMWRQDWTAECDLTEKQAKKRFAELKKDGSCMWAELVGEDDHNYMEIIDSFDRTEEVRKIQIFLEAFKEAFAK